MGPAIIAGSLLALDDGDPATPGGPDSVNPLTAGRSFPFPGQREAPQGGDGPQGVPVHRGSRR